MPAATNKSNPQPPIDAPPDAADYFDFDWRGKIELARREREAAIKARKGKPMGFPKYPHKPLIPRPRPRSGFVCV